MDYAPIVLFTYNRPLHTQRVIDALLKNDLAPHSDLVVFSDAAKTHADRQSVEEVRKFLATVTGFRSTTIHHRQDNLGLASSIIGGIAQVLSQHDRLIVIEDDLLTSPCFLKYMNDALDYYESDERVISIHGYMFPIGNGMPETLFLRGADCWGWATWKRGWELFNPDGRQLLDELQQRGLTREFDYNGAAGFTNMLKAQISGRNNSWAIRWHASAFLTDRLTLYPGQSLVQNIGNDDSGIHCRKNDCFDVTLRQVPVHVGDIPVASSVAARQAIERYYRRLRPSILRRLLERIRVWLSPGTSGNRS